NKLYKSGISKSAINEARKFRTNDYIIKTNNKGIGSKISPKKELLDLASKGKVKINPKDSTENIKCKLAKAGISERTLGIKDNTIIMRCSPKRNLVDLANEHNIKLGSKDSILTIKNKLSKGGISKNIIERSFESANINDDSLTELFELAAYYIEKIGKKDSVA